MTSFQPMPDLTEEEYNALRDDIKARGILVPVVLDQHGRTLDGHNRRAIAAELGIDCPTEVREVADDNAAMEIALTLNLTRRHLSSAQKRDIIRNELLRCEMKDSDRAIGKRVGADHKTVGSVRSQMKQDAQESVDKARQAMQDGLSELYRIVHGYLLKGCDLDDAIALAEGVRDATREGAVRDAKTRDEIKSTFPDLIDHYVFGGLAAELVALREELSKTDWSPANMPTPTADDDAAFRHLFVGVRTPRVGNFPTSAEIA